MTSLRVSSNFKSNTKNFDFEVLESDLFERINKNLRFSLIIANLPFDFKPIVADYAYNQFTRSFKDENHIVLLRFLENAKNFMDKNGKLILIFSDTIGNRDILNDALSKNLYKVEYEYKEEFQTPTIKNAQKRNTYNCIILSALRDIPQDNLEAR